MRKDKPMDKLAEECADLLILVMGTAISAGLHLNDPFWHKMQKIMQRVANERPHPGIGVSIEPVASISGNYRNAFEACFLNIVSS
jgi:hypothetical protein